MNGSKLFNQVKKANSGPGTIKCGCCRRGPYGFAKRMTHKLLRAYLKREARLQAEADLC